MWGRFVTGPDGRKKFLPHLDQHGRSIPNPLARLAPALAAIPYQSDVRPSQTIPIAVDLAGELLSAMWWFVPSWARDLASARRMTTFNARIETVAGARTYRAAWAAGRRCLIPMLGYYEWRDEGAKKKQRYLFRPGNGGYLWAAGLWETWTPRGDQDGPPITSCTMIVRPARDDLGHIHDRSPAFIADELAEEWLGAADSQAAMALLVASELPPLLLEPVPGPVVEWPGSSGETAPRNLPA